MFKKSFAALAVLGFCASYANASSVILYGVVDEALVFTHEKFDVTGEEGTKTNTFGLESGLNAPSRFGLRGVEDLGNGLQVSFVAENSFSADDGSLGMGRLFGRELSATVSGDFGRVSLGRMGGVGSSAGSYDLVYAYGDAFDGGDNNIFGLAASSRYDNMVTYQTPDFAGVKATVQYSFNEDSTDKDREGSSAVDRYASAALTGNFGALNTVLAYEFQNYQSFGTDVNPSVEDGHTVYLGGNYDCGFAKTFVMGQYFKGVPDELEEAAYVDGAGVIKTFIRIILPMSVPMLVTIFMFAFSWQWTDEFYTGLFFTDKTKNWLLPNIVKIPASLDTEYAAQSTYEVAIRNTCGLMILAPLVIIYLFAQRTLIEGVERSGITG